MQLKKKIAGQCPCGFFFETSSSENVAVAMIQSHIESFHEDILPFGITNEEAQMLLKVEYMEEGKQRISAGTFHSSKTKRVPNSKSTNRGSSKKPKRKRVQLTESSFS